MFTINVAHQKLKESDKIGSLPYYPKTQKFGSGSTAGASRADFGKVESNTGSRIILNFKQLHVKNISTIKPKDLNLRMFKRFTLFSLGKQITCSCCQSIRIPLEDDFFKPAELHRSNLFSKHWAQVQSAIESAVHVQGTRKSTAI